MVGDSRALNQVQGPSGHWALSECPMRLTLFAGKDYTQKSSFSSTLAYRENHTISSVVSKYRKLQSEGLDLLSFSYEVKQGIGSSQ